MFLFFLLLFLVKLRRACVMASIYEGLGVLLILRLALLGNDCRDFVVWHQP